LLGFIDFCKPKAHPRKNFSKKEKPSPHGKSFSLFKTSVFKNVK